MAKRIVYTIKVEVTRADEGQINGAMEEHIAESIGDAINEVELPEFENGRGEEIGFSVSVLDYKRAD